MKNCKVSISKDGKEQEFKIRKGMGFQALCLKEETPIEFSCRKSDCGICIFKVLEGEENLSDPGEREKDFLNAMRADSDERLACQCRVFGDVKIFLEF